MRASFVSASKCSLELRPDASGGEAAFSEM
jgi:hypothetical protein